MNLSLWPGKYIFAAAIAALGVQHFVVADNGPRFLPVLPWIPAMPALAYLTGTFLIGTATCIAANFRPRLAAIALGSFLLASEWLLQIDRLLPDRTVAFEILALASGALMLARILPPDTRYFLKRPGLVDKILQAGRYLFAISCVVFGVDHFIYLKFVAGLVPAWIPGPLFWTAFTGAFMIVAGIAIAAKRFDQLTANFLGLMFLLWFLLLHVPRLFVPANSHNPNEWSSAAIALAMCGACWIIGCDSARRKRAPAA
jgi:uncharacterized membrane protein